MAFRCTTLAVAALGMVALGGCCAHPRPSADPPSVEGRADGNQPAESSTGEPRIAAPEHEGEPLVEIELTRNSGEALVACADRITHIELSDGETVLMRFDDAVRDELVESLRGAEIVDSLSATPPPWPGIYVLIHVEGVEGRSEPFVASIVGVGQLRLNAKDPTSLNIADEQGAPDFENVRDVGTSELMFDAAAAYLGGPDSIESSPAGC